MSYQVIARKWRPNNFAELLGQEHISQTLINAIKTERLPHALLFTGLRGTGKTSSARILAKTLRCPNIKDFIPCETCSDCTDINSGRSVNVIEIDGASNNGVDSIRELRDAVGYMPSSGHYKIYIIDEVHMLSTNAFNALLKTLEEPPEHVIFIMATTEVHKVPHTILSRCQRFDFRRFPTSLIASSLENICKGEEVKADKDALWLIARQADGSLRDSQSLLDQIISFSGKDITREAVTNVLGLTNRQLLLDSLKALSEQNSNLMFEVLRSLTQSGADPVVYARELLEEIRNLLLIKVSGGKSTEIVDLPDTEVAELFEISKNLSEPDIHKLFDMALKGGNEIPRSQDPLIILEVLMMRMVHAPKIQNIGSFIASQPTVSVTMSSVASAPSVQAPQPKAPSPTPAAITPAAAPEPVAPVGNNLQAHWSGLIQKVKPANMAIAAKLENSFLQDLTDTELHIGVPTKMKFLFDQLNNDDLKNKVKNYIKTFWGKDLNIIVSMQSNEVKKKVLTPKVMEKLQNQKDEETLRKKIEDHPMIKEANSLFKTNIVSISDSIKEKS